MPTVHVPIALTALKEDHFILVFAKKASEEKTAEVCRAMKIHVAILVSFVLLNLVIDVVFFFVFVSEKDPCQPNPCLNGNCNEISPEVAHCNCSGGWNGDLCESECCMQCSSVIWAGCFYAPKVVTAT